MFAWDFNEIIHIRIQQVARYNAKIKGTVLLLLLLLLILLHKDVGRDLA